MRTKPLALAADAAVWVRSAVVVLTGVPERVAMAISGHKTRAVFERYNIASGRNLKDAARQLEKYLATQNWANSGQVAHLGKGPRKGGLTR